MIAPAPLIVVVGSTSSHKIAAVREACSELNIVAEVRGAKTASGVHEQPRGLDETWRGASNRARAACAAEPQAQLTVGIESGIVDTGAMFLDMAVVVVRSSERILGTATSPGVVFPDVYVHEASRRGPDCTVGSVMAERCGADPTDGTAFLTGGRLTRARTLVHGVVAALAQALAQET